MLRTGHTMACPADFHLTTAKGETDKKNPLGCRGPVLSLPDVVYQRLLPFSARYRSI